jgi:hypothetical protein
MFVCVCDVCDVCDVCVCVWNQTLVGLSLSLPLRFFASLPSLVVSTGEQVELANRTVLNEYTFCTRDGGLMLALNHGSLFNHRSAS